MVIFEKAYPSSAIDNPVLKTLFEIMFIMLEISFISDVSLIRLDLRAFLVKVPSRFLLGKLTVWVTH